MTNKQMAEASKKYLFNNYGERDMALVRGQGARVWDADGNEYIDMLAGIAVCNVGHCHPKVVEAAQRQLTQLIHVSNLFNIEPQIQLAQRLVDNSFADKVFFCNSGAEAVEGALKLARRYGTSQRGSECVEFIAAENSFHGRTFGAISATGQEKYRKGFEPLLPGVRFVPFNEIKAFDDAFSERTCGVILEPIQGEGGVMPACREYLQHVRSRCSETNTVLIFDEIQCGMGRTGRLFAHEHYGIEPDVMTLAKALGGGLPVGALLARDRFADVLGPGTHASTFGGNPVVMAAALAVLELLIEGGLLERCAQLGAYFKDRLSQLAEHSPKVKEVRGAGLMLGVVLDSPAKPVMMALREKGILCATALDTVVRFVPPFVIEKADIDRTVDALGSILKSL
ncbi:MAG TPA: acetylornithine transaminase [bacterium]|nr:acetylornithine transaminase [bacterium]